MPLEILSEKKVTFRIHEDLFWELKELAVSKRTNTTDLLNEAIRDVLVKYGKRKK